MVFYVEIYNGERGEFEHYGTHGCEQAANEQADKLGERGRFARVVPEQAE